MTEEQLYGAAVATMAAESLELDETQPTDRRRHNRGVPGNRGGGRPAKRKTLLIDGVLQDGHYQLVAITSETIVLQTINSGQAPGKE